MTYSNTLSCTEVPQASPDSNNETMENKQPRRIRSVAAGLGSILLVSAMMFCFVKAPIAIHEKIQEGGVASRRNLSSQQQLCTPPMPGDTCNSEQSYEQCLLLEEHGCRHIQSSRSCPPVHSCADQCIRPPPFDECANEESYGECLLLEHQGCQNIIATASCPPQFSCTDPDTKTFGQPGQPIQPAPPSQCLPPSPEAVCITEESYGECLKLEQQGCQAMISTYSCPPHFSCAIPQTPSHQLEPASESQCLPPSPEADCITEESYGECLRLEQHGCQNMISTASCPPHFSCVDVSIPSQPIETPSQCFHPVAGDPCSDEESYEQCLLLEQEGCETIVSTFSCPPIYSCFDASQTQATTKSNELPTQGRGADTTTTDFFNKMNADAHLAHTSTKSMGQTQAKLGQPQSQCSPPDGCDSDESYQQCLHLESHGCESMASTYACPPTYWCVDPVESAEHDSQCVAPRENDDCLTNESYQECLHLEAHGCQTLISTASCPPNYGCADPPKPVLPTEESVCVAPMANDQCHSQQSYLECLHLEAHGCEAIVATLSCPPQYNCASPAAPGTPVQPIYAPPPAHPIESQCTAPSNDGCHTEESFRECLALEASGCTDMISTDSCPPHYSCAGTTISISKIASENVYPSQALPAQPIQVAQTLPEHPNTVETNPCIAPSSTDICHTEESYQQCLVLQREGCNNLMATRSCPPVYACGDEPIQHPLESQCTPPAEGNCQTEESYQECLGLESDGCGSIMATRSCPPSYRCSQQ